MSKPKILIQLDSDPQPSVFDAIVAVDSGVDQLFRHGGVSTEEVRELVYGAMFTRGPQELRDTAVFVGGSDVSKSQELFDKVRKSFFGPMRVSVMLDANGANTTAAAAVVAAGRHAKLDGCTAAVLAATGAVGQRCVQLLASQRAKVRVASRSESRATEVCARILQRYQRADLEPRQAATAEQTADVLDGADVVIAAGAPGIRLSSINQLSRVSSLEVAVDLNAVPPLGIEGVEVTDKAADKDGMLVYGAVGVGGTKMKIHKAAIRRLFTANDVVLDAAEIFEIGMEVEAS